MLGLAIPNGVDREVKRQALLKGLAKLMLDVRDATDKDIDEFLDQSDLTIVIAPGGKTDA
jgi:hypothetical protein